MSDGTVISYIWGPDLSTGFRLMEHSSDLILIDAVDLEICGPECVSQPSPGGKLASTPLTARPKTWMGGACASPGFAHAQQKNCVCRNNQGAASDAPPVRRQTAIKLPRAMLGDSLFLGAAARRQRSARVFCASPGNQDRFRSNAGR
jgi:hypothetical protein